MSCTPQNRNCSQYRENFRRATRLALMLVVIPASLAVADPVVVDEGFIAIDTEGGLYLNFGNAHLGVQSTNATLPWQPLGLTVDCLAAPCAAGTLMGFGTSTSGIVSLGPAYAYASGTNYGVVDLSGELSFTSPGFQLPGDPGAEPFPNPHVPFTFTGTLTASRNGEVLFSHQLVGSGTASIFLRSTSEGYVPDEAAALTYKFTPAQTPEPASLLLLGTGVAGLLGRRRRRD